MKNIIREYNEFGFANLIIFFISYFFFKFNFFYSFLIAMACWVTYMMIKKQIRDNQLKNSENANEKHDP